MSDDSDKCPAPAGMILPGATALNALSEMPRTCGDDPRTANYVRTSIINAPHLRG